MQYYADLELIDGEFYDIELWFRVEQGETKLILQWESDSIEKEVIPGEYLYNTLYADATPFTFAVDPAATNPLSSIVDGTDYQTASVGVQEVVTVYARDYFENQVDHNDDTVTASLTSEDGLTTVNGVIAAVSDGEWTVTYTLTVAATYDFVVNIRPDGSTVTEQIYGSPFSVVCSVSNTDPSKTVISGTGSTTATAGEVTTFTVTQFDSGNNQRTEGGDALGVTVTGSDSSVVTAIEVFDNNDGTYTVNYMVTKSSITYTIAVTTNGDTGNTKTSSVTAYAAQPDATRSTIAVTTPATIDNEETLTFTLNDAYDNDIIILQPVVIVVYGQGQYAFGTGDVTTLSTGSYEAKFTVPSGTDGTLCGDYSVTGYILASGGL